MTIRNNSYMLSPYKLVSTENKEKMTEYSFLDNSIIDFLSENKVIEKKQCEILFEFPSKIIKKYENATTACEFFMLIAASQMLSWENKIISNTSTPRHPSHKSRICDYLNHTLLNISDENIEQLIKSFSRNIKTGILCFKSEKETKKSLVHQHVLNETAQRIFLTILYLKFDIKHPFLNEEFVICKNRQKG